MSRALLALAVLATLSGCATCRENPLPCAAAVVVVGAVAAQQLDRGQSADPARPRDCFGHGAGACL